MSTMPPVPMPPGNLIRHFNPKCKIPTENSMTEFVEKLYVKPLINFPKTIGPISWFFISEKKVIIGCLVGESINIRQAEALMKKINIYVCKSHIEETHREIYKKLCSHESEDLNPDSKIPKVMTTVSLLMPELKLSTFQQILNEFLIKHNYMMNGDQTEETDSLDESEKEEERLEESDYYLDGSDCSPDDATLPIKKYSPDASTSSAEKS
ncbi:hypothetical protein CRE_21404 [Caenorhabditis remanei]|uniref:Lin-15A/B-like domain-containing protein n=1 Tax=Caenorhabditis remanei TaxID=31234 RepID=E3MUR3_CAERE|nr:hypothetical protein CRE_21404 [Caenorhabditis remanei]